MSDKKKLPQHANNRQLRDMVQSESTRADAWKAIAGRLAKVPGQVHVKQCTCELCQALQAFDALSKSEG